MAPFVEQSLDLQLVLEADFAPGLAASLMAGMSSLVESLRQGSSSTALPQIEQQRVVAALEALWAHAITQATQLVFTTHAEKKSEETAVIQRIIHEFFTSRGRQTALQINYTTEQQIQALISGGLRRGEAQSTVMQTVLDKLPGIADLRGLLITRTEIHAATQYAGQRAAEAVGHLTKKTWHSVHDDRTRDFGLSGKISQFNHRVMHGDSVPLNHSFLVPTLFGGVEALYFPGDPNGSAGNVINCRCVQSFE
jgi:hypothetical protein